MKKRYWFLTLLLLAVSITYFAGPTPPEPVYTANLPELPEALTDLENHVISKEKQQPTRNDNQARIRWYDNAIQQTEFSIVYLHGFAGSYRDGYPVNVQLADSIKANSYLARWGGHGLKPPFSMNNFSPDTAWESAKEALAIGKKIGRKVIILSTSTGGTLAIKLAAEFPNDIFAIINLSPNLEDDQTGTYILETRWGYEIASLVSMGKNKEIEEKGLAQQYWDTLYPSKALVELQVLVGTTMVDSTFKKVTCPVLTLYYHENFYKEDEHVEVDIYKDVHDLFSTPDSLVELTALPTPRSHFLGSAIKSQDTEIVLKEILQFLEKINVKI